MLSHVLACRCQVLDTAVARRRGTIEITTTGVRMDHKESKPLCKVTDVPVDGLRQFNVAPGKAVCLINAGKQFYACEAHCPHEGIALCEGAFDDGILTCLEHLWQWNLPAGGKAEGLAEKDLKMYKVSVKRGLVFVTDSVK